MARTQNWPAWRYGPKGEGQIFAAESDVPKGWVDHPDKQPPVEEQRSDGEDGGMQALRAENEQLREEVSALSLTMENQEVLLERLRGDAESLSRTVERIGEENENLRTENNVLRAAAPPNSSVQPDSSSARRPRKLSAAEPPLVTTGDETITQDEGRAERLRVLREAGITIVDDATDGDIEEALNWLEKNGGAKD